ncbi:PepSY domain-containing protein [Prevotella jejuni]
MKRRTWRKYHKWTGLIISFFLVMFCLSGIVLNHRRCFADVNVSRAVLPGRYDFKH